MWEIAVHLAVAGGVYDDFPNFKRRLFCIGFLGDWLFCIGFLGDFRCGVLFFIVILVIYK